MKHVARFPRVAALSAAVMSITGIAAAQTHGPSSSQPSYVLPSAPGVATTSLLTVGDSVGGYRMVGIPDGAGAFDNGDGTFTVLLNHELGSTVGVVRDHGGRGAFVSRWVVAKSNLVVLEGDDLIKTLYIWDAVANDFVIGNAANPLTSLNRLCSADLPAATAFYDPATGLGTTSRIFMDGEETTNGRAFAHVVTGPEAGKSWELPWTGKYAWENHVASPHAQQKTVVMGLDDSSRLFSSEGATQPSEVYVWVGEKQAAGTEIEKAGLRTGVLHGIRVGTPGSYDANEGGVTSGDRFELVALSDQTNNTTFSALQTESIAKTVTQFRRVEDGAWDPNSPNDFYFVTTDQFGSSGFSKLWRLRFDDIENPEAGGVIEILINGVATGTNSGFGTGEMYDNIAVDAKGRVILQEDVGNQAHLGKVLAYDIASAATLELTRHSANLFLSSSPGYIGTQDEENSGVIDLSAILGEGTYLMTDQVHRNIAATEPELVEMGQVQIMTVGATAGIGFDAGTNQAAFVALGTDDGQTIVLTDSSATVDGVLLDSGVVSGVAATKVLANGYAGNDKITAGGIAVPAGLFGGAGRDIVTGGFSDDLIVGGEGHDNLKGGGGSDTIVQ